MTIGLLKEPSHETRVSLLAEAVATLTKKGITVIVEKGAGLQAFSSDADYEKAGAQIKSREDVAANANIILSIHHPEPSLRFKPDVVLIGVYHPLFNYGLMKEFATKGMTVFSLDMLPRTTRAQAMDVLSSQANIAGYKAVLLAANTYSRYFPMFMTAAGTIAPAKVMILGAGVAGLQAIAGEHSHLQLCDAKLVSADLQPGLAHADRERLPRRAAIGTHEHAVGHASGSCPSGTPIEQDPAPGRPSGG